MKKLLISIYKEGILLLRDIEGVIVMFVMPLILVMVVALLQQKSFDSINEEKIPVVIIDFDNEILGESLIEGLRSSNMFEITVVSGGDSTDLAKAKQSVAEGYYQIGIYVPQNTTAIVKGRAVSLVQQQIPGAVQSAENNLNAQGQIHLFFDPITKQSFKGLAKSTLMQFSSSVETKIVFEAYSKFIDALTNQSSELDFPDKPAIEFNESLVSEYTKGIIPNAVQHNVPAWILFGMFLICIPIAGNIIKERGDGCLARLKTMPVSYLQIMVGKVFVFVGICLIQALLMVLVGIVIMPLIGLPQLQVNGNWFALISVSLASGFAATGYGILIGSISSTQIQASAFGSVSTVIFAAIGGAWIPVMIMPGVMQKISSFSPMNWGIHGYYDVFLRSASTFEVLPDIGKLMLFSAICIGGSLFFKKYAKQ
ncbi:ABC transporter permease [bacterium]|nr:ABC transporter permease [bacterium]